MDFFFPSGIHQQKVKRLFIVLNNKRSWWNSNRSQLPQENDQEILLGYKPYGNDWINELNFGLAILFYLSFIGFLIIRNHHFPNYGSLTAMKSTCGDLADEITEFIFFVCDGILLPTMWPVSIFDMCFWICCGPWVKF